LARAIESVVRAVGRIVVWVDAAAELVHGRDRIPEAGGQRAPQRRSCRF